MQPSLGRSCWWRSPDALALAAMLLLALIALAPVLVSPQPLVPAQASTDLNLYFRHIRAFAAAELRHGRLPLWNPHVFGGQSFIGSFQSALFYPMNLLYVALPLRWALNAFCLLHLLLAGAGVYGWARGRGLHALAALVAGGMFMFGSAYYLRLQAGHLTILAAGAWLGWLFWGVDRLLRRPSWRAVWLTTAVAAHMLLAGHPQTVYYAGLSAGLYVLLHLRRTRRRGRTLGALAAVGVLALLLGAVQLLPGVEAAGTSVRAGGASQAFSATFSLPPENLLTLLAPDVLGDGAQLPYWGRWYYWEVCVHVGVIGLLLAGVGACFGARRQRRFMTLLALVLLVIALGSSTPVFAVLWRWLPGFASFRGTCKIALHLSLFLALLAGVGVQRLLIAALPRRGMIALLAVTVVLSISLLICALLLRQAVVDGQAAPGWMHWLKLLAQSQQSYLKLELYDNVTFARDTSLLAARQLAVAAALLLAGAGLAALRHCSRRWAVVMACVALLELTWFASRHTRVMSLDDGWPRDLPRRLAQLPPDARVLNLFRPNVAMSLGTLDVWGYDPLVAQRYAQLVGMTQGVDPDHATYAVRFERVHPLLQLLRCHAILGLNEQGGLRVAAMADPLPRFLLVDHCEVLTNRDDILRTLTAHDFAPRQRVILEQQPNPAPVAGAEGTVRVLEESTDQVTLEVQTSAPTVLLMTDSYDPGWRATALPGSVQVRYDVLPGDYALRAVPLQAGRHLLRMTYQPRCWTWAWGLSVTGLLLWLALGAGVMLAARRPGR